MVKFSDHLTKQIANLKTLSLGARNVPVAISNIGQTSLPSDTSNSIFDVTLNICGGLKTFQILFDLEHPTFCPDVIVDSDEDFSPDISSLKGFLEWKITSETALRNLVTDLHTSYLSHQRSVILKYPQFRDQMKELVSDHVNGAMCEVDISKRGPGTYNDTVKILVPMNVDYTLLPPYVKAKKPGKDGCRLCISFETPNLTKITPTLELSAGVQSALSKMANLRIPPYGKSTIIEYVNGVHKLLTNTISEIGTAFKRRESFIYHLLSDIGESIIELDNVAFYEATFLLEIDGFYFILFVILGPKFPTECPSLFLQSIYSMDASADIFRVSLQGFPYHPQWSDELMFANIKKVIHGNIQEFKKKSLAC